MQAFNYCTNLQYINIPTEMKEISSSMFHGCSSLESIIIPENITEIGGSAFSGCINLKSIVIPKNIIRIHDGAFENCTNLETVTIESSPEISSKAFKNCNRLKSIEIKGYYIGEEAFANCTSLTSVIISGRPGWLPKAAFSGCTNLTNVVIPEGVKTINDNVFKDCTSLKRLEIPESVTSISTTAFPEGITLCGMNQSYAETYANENNINFIRKCRVTFKNYDDSILKQEIVYVSESVTAPEVPTREGYTFTGWDKEYSNITENTEITAQYNINTYTVTFKDYNGNVLETQTVEHGKNATTPENPIREGYTFTGWNREYNNITENIEVMAQYNINTYTVTFKDYNGNVLDTKTVEHGKGVTAPDAPERIGYTFTGWDKEYNNIIGNTEITAQYNINTYTVTFKDYDGSILETQTVEYGKGATTPENPTREGYTFTAWNKEYSSITENIEITAQYNINTYTVTFKDYNGNILDTQKVEHGKSATPPNAPEKPADGVFIYEFVGWDNDYTNIESDLIITAQYRGSATQSPWALYKENNEEITITKYLGKEEEIIIPSTLLNYPVTAINTQIFNDNANVKSIIIPSTIKTINSNAFGNIDKNTLIIYGYENSSAQLYSQQNGIKFIAIEEPTTRINKNGIEFYEISNEKQLTYISQMAGEWLNKNYILVNDLQLNSINIEYNTETGELITSETLLRKWKPIGANGEEYTGIFDGNNHKISGVYINDMEQKGELYIGTPGTGLFGTISNGMIKNLNIENSYVRALTSVGGIVGTNAGANSESGENSKIENCTFSGAVVGSYKVGGIVGCALDEVSNCTNNGNVYGKIYHNFDGIEYAGDFVGGVIGDNMMVKSSNLINNGKVIANGEYIGGIAGNSTMISQEIADSHNSGNVSGKNYVGGITGGTIGKISNTYNTGKVSGVDSIGGIAGYFGGVCDDSIGTFNSHNEGTIEGNNFVGGIVGENSATISECYNTGKVKGELKVAGIAGSLESSNIVNSYNTGDITAKEAVAGLVGVVPASDIEIQNSYNSGNISGDNTVGGLAGDMQGKILNSYNLGNITGKEVGVGGLAGGIGPGGLNAGVFNSYNKGNVEGASNVGGLVGVNCVKFSNSYNTGKVTGKEQVGGLVGVNIKVVDEYDGNFTTLEKCYSIGKVEGTTKTGGIVGENSYSDNANIQKCYYLKDSTINVNNDINGISNNEDKENVVVSKLKEFFPIYLDKNADASYENLGYKKQPDKPKPEELPFTDVKKTDWYYNSVKYVYNNKIILGKTETLFKPNDKLTRGQLVTILWRMAGAEIVDAPNKFTDVKNGDYYYEAVKWASSKKVVNGVSSDKFAPNKNITREQLAVMLNNYAKYKKQKIDKLQDISQYKDVKGISNYAVDAVKWAIGNKIISGKDKGTRIDPRGNASRAEASAMIQNYYTYVK